MADTNVILIKRKIARDVVDFINEMEPVTNEKVSLFFVALLGALDEAQGYASYNKTAEVIITVNGEPLD